jgi:hypothetical protein
MAFALSIERLEQACHKDGCPICRLEHDAAVQSITAFLWEHANDSTAREPVNRSYGLCPPHTRLLVASELSSSGNLPGVHMIYEVLARNASQELAAAARSARKPSFLSRLIPTAKQAGRNLLEPSGNCPICDIAQKSAVNNLNVLYEEILANDELRSIYTQSTGICMQHIRQGNALYGFKHPQAAAFINQHAADTLQKNRTEMQEYLRKQNWEYREEGLTADEKTAWLKVLAFFTGLPAKKFNHHIKEF